VDNINLRWLSLPVRDTMEYLVSVVLADMVAFKLVLGCLNVLFVVEVAGNPGACRQTYNSGPEYLLRLRLVCSGRGCWLAKSGQGRHQQQR
jgi:hypothetical protein